jgi:uncharacterized repeat protein (TIGR03837 family)
MPYWRQWTIRTMPASSTPPPRPHCQATDQGWLWDIFCRVIDNFGDIGVCWRLAADLATRGHTVRLWLDDAQALPWMALGALEGRWPGITVHSWNAASNVQLLSTLVPAQVWVEGFGCELPEAFVASRARAQDAPPVWINLEYLSAEDFVERSHGLPSPLMSGAAKGWTKHFFYPGFTPHTGGLLREPDLLAQRIAFGSSQRVAFFNHVGVADHGEALVSLFCYANAPVAALLDRLRGVKTRVHLLVTHGQAQAAVQSALERLPLANDGVRITSLPLLSQTQFDHLLWISDLNFVRGEDSLVRALWAGRPFVWQIYPQQDGAHRAKLDAFLDVTDAPAPVRDWHGHWNGFGNSDVASSLPLGEPKSASQAWQAWADGMGLQIAGQADLVSQLCAFVQAVPCAGQAPKKR